MEYRKVAALIIIIGIAGFVINGEVHHYQGGEIYEAAIKAYGLLVRGFNVTVQVETVNGRHITGTLLNVRGSTISLVVNGTVLTVGGPEATRENLKAKLIKVEYHGKVFLYEVPPLYGKGSDVFSKLLVESYSDRYSGNIYIDGNVSPIKIGMLKYQADYKTYGSITINAITSNGAVITASMVPVQYLQHYLSNYTVYAYGILYVNSNERNLPLKLLEVRNA